MKIVIFGATGRTGIPLVQQALEQGHEVTAFVRNKNKIAVRHERLTVLAGDVFDETAVAGAIQGQDAVLSVLGHSKGSPKHLLSSAMRNIVAGMKMHGVTRLVSLTGAGVPAPKDVRQGGFSRFMHLMLKLLAKELLEDSIKQKDLIAASPLEWTIVRAPRLLEGPKAGGYRTGYFKFGKPMINRSDVADFMLKEMTEKRYLNEYPLIGF